MEIMPLWTKNAEKELWFYLGLFSQEDYVRKALFNFNKNLTTSEAKDRAFRVNSCISQAKEYYDAAKSVSILTRRLLVYYGMYSLAKALIYLKNPLIDLNTLKHHGLKRPEIPDSARKLLSSKTELHSKGVFYHFSKLSQHNYCTIDVGEEEGQYESVNVIPLTTHFEDIPIGQVFVLGALFLSIPELFDVFLLTGRKRLRLYQIHMDLHKNISGNWKRLLVVYKRGNKKLSKKSLQRKFPEISTSAELTTESEDAILFDRSTHNGYEKLVPKRLVESTTGGLFLLSPGNSTSDMNSIFIIMFLLSNIVRYKPPLWQKILSSNHKIMIEKFVSTAERKFPYQIINELLGKIIHFQD